MSAQGYQPNSGDLTTSVNRQELTSVVRKLLATPPLPKSSIPRKRTTRMARPKAPIQK